MWSARLSTPKNLTGLLGSTGGVEVANRRGTGQEEGLLVKGQLSSIVIPNERATDRHRVRVVVACNVCSEPMHRTAGRLPATNVGAPPAAPFTHTRGSLR